MPSPLQQKKETILGVKVCVGMILSNNRLGDEVLTTLTGASALNASFLSFLSSSVDKGEVLPYSVALGADKFMLTLHLLEEKRSEK